MERHLARSRFRSWNIEGYLAAIRCPILCIQGEEDEYGTIAQVEAIKAQVPQTEIVMLPDCKHSPHRDQAEWTLERMAEFVARLERVTDPAEEFGAGQSGPLRSTRRTALSDGSSRAAAGNEVTRGVSPG